MLFVYFMLMLTTLSCIQCTDHGGHCCSNGDRDPKNCNRWCLFDAKQYDYCSAQYVPGGTEIILEPIDAPTATLKDYSNAHEASQAGFLVTLASDVIDFVPTGVKKFSEKFAKGLGIFGSVIGGVGDFMTPTPDQILDAVNAAIAELTEEVNTQFTNMQGYVDQAILQAQTDAMTDFLGFFAEKFANCIDETTEALFMNCLVQTERDIHAASSNFMRFQDSFNHDSFVPTVDDVKRMEMEFITFMNYATLRTINLLIMYDTYNNRTGTTADLQTCRFLTSLQTDLRAFIEYTENVYDAIIKGHNQDNSWEYFLTNAEKSKHVEDHNSGGYWEYTQGWYKYRLSMMLVDSDTYYCTDDLKIRHTQKCGKSYCPILYDRNECSIGHNDGYQAMQCHSRDRAYDTYKKYTENMVESAQNYWKPQTTDRMTPWKEISDQVDEKRATKGCDEIENSEYKEEL